MDKQGIIFDFDYTLGDSTEAICAGYEKGFAVMGHPAPEREAVRRTVGYTLQDGYTILTGDGNEENRERFYQLFQQFGKPLMLEGTVLLPGAAELLRALKKAEIPAAIVSTKLGETIRDIFAHQGILDLLAFVVGGKDVKNHKPDPEGLLSAINRLEIPKEKILFCGDTIIDAETAQRGEVDFCAVLNGTTGRDAFEAFPSLYIAENLFELRNWFKI